MRLPSAHFRRLLDDDPETRRLLDATDDALVRSNALMRQTFVALGRSRRENEQQRKMLAEYRRVRPSA